MAKKRSCIGFIFGFVAILCTDSRGQTGLEQQREEVFKVAFSQVGLLEKGHNKNPKIIEFHQSVNRNLAKIRPVPPYCASFVWWCFQQAGIKPTRINNPARARDWFAAKDRIVLTQQTLRGNRRMMKLPEKGDVIGYVFSGGAISHVEIFERFDLENGWVWAVGGNTSARQSATSVNREGEGVFYVRRKLKMVYAIANPFIP